MTDKNPLECTAKNCIYSSLISNLTDYVIRLSTTLFINHVLLLTWARARSHVLVTVFVACWLTPWHQSMENISSSITSFIQDLLDYVQTLGWGWISLQHCQGGPDALQITLEDLGHELLTGKGEDNHSNLCRNVTWLFRIFQKRWQQHPN